MECHYFIGQCHQIYLRGDNVQCNHRGSFCLEPSRAYSINASITSFENKRSLTLYCESLYIEQPLWNFGFYDINRLFFSVTFTTLSQTCWLLSWKLNKPYTFVQTWQCCEIQVLVTIMAAWVIWLPIEDQFPVSQSVYLRGNSFSKMFRNKSEIQNFISRYIEAKLLHLLKSSKSVSVYINSSACFNLSRPACWAFVLALYDLRPRYSYYQVKFAAKRYMDNSFHRMVTSFWPSRVGIAQ